MNDVPAVTLNAGQSVASVDDELRVVGDHLPIVGVVVRYDDNAIVFLQGFETERDASKAEIVATHLGRSRDVRIVVGDLRAQTRQPVH